LRSFSRPTKGAEQPARVVARAGPR
jgi:hypothetical protein